MGINVKEIYIVYRTIYTMVNFSHNDIKRGTKIPNNETKILAEFFGILIGDGYIGKYGYNYVIEITGNKIKDMDYLENYVSKLINKFFNITPNLREKKNENTMYLRLMSKATFQFLNKKGFKIGVKGRIKTPKWIKNKNSFMIEFIKGFFDTDGSVNFKNKEGKLYPTISIGSKSDLLLKEMKSFLTKQGINSYFATIKHHGERYKHPFETYQIQINGYKRILLWFSKIGSNNPRNINRFHEMIKLRLLKCL